MENGKVTTDELADMIKHGFDEMGNEISNRFEKVEHRLSKLEEGQTDIKARIDNVVHRFEFHELERRVENLELKLQTKN